MKKEYVIPDFKIYKITLKDAILASITEETIPEVIGGDDGGGGSVGGTDPLEDF